MTAYTVTAGATSSGIVLRNGDELDVLSGGVAIDTVVSSGGAAYVYNGGLANFTVVSDGGAAYVYNGGQANGTSVGGGGTEYVYNGGTASGTAIDMGGAEMVLSGGIASATAIRAGGSQLVNTGGIASFAVVSAGGTQTVSGGTAHFTVLSGGTQSALAGGIASGTAIGSGGTEHVASGGIASFTIVSAGGTETVAGGVAGGSILSGGFLIVTAGGIASGTTAGSGGTVFVEDGGIGRDTIVRAGGSEYVFTGGVASASFVGSGGSETIQFGGTVTGAMVSGGTEYVAYGGTVSGAILRDGGLQFVYSGANAVDTVVASGGIEAIRAGEVVSGTVLAQGGSIDLVDFGYGGGVSATLDPIGGLLRVIGGGNLYEQTLGGLYANLAVQAGANSGTGTLIGLMAAPVAPAPCFAAGTRIATDRGQFAVETLRPGDRVLLHDGGMAPIVWIGHRRVDCARHPHPEQVWPFRVAAGAFGPGLPRRDLYLSPDHAVWVTDALVPIKYLAAGVDIVQVPWAEATYFHIELDEHDVLLAEGLPVESYLDTGDRARFDNGGKVATLHPDFSARAWDALGCAKLILSGPALEAARRHVARARGLRRRGAPTSNTSTETVALSDLRPDAAAFARLKPQETPAQAAPDQAVTE